MVLSTGNKNEKIKLTHPGFYDYSVNFYGDYRGRKFDGNGKVSIRITEKHEVQIEE